VPEPGAKRELDAFKWGLIPSWAKDMKVAYRTINAQPHSVTTKPAFRSAFKKRRCLVLDDGYYEWLCEGKAKQPLLYEVGGANAIERRSRRASTMLTIRAQVGPRRGSRGHPPEFASGRIAGQHQQQWSPLAYNAPHQITGGGMMAAQDPDQRKSKLEALWKEDRGDFLEEYRRVMGKSPGELRCSFTVASMVEQILAREFPLDPAR
jgi:SOS response associated peptidase (SRAP)